MKQAYSEISPATGAIMANICTIHIMPVEWLAKSWKPLFTTGIVPDVNIVPGKYLIEISLVQPTYNLQEKNRTAKGIDTYELSFTAETNELSAETMQVLNTYRYHQWLIIYKVAENKYKIAGNKNAGLYFSYDNLHTNERNEQRIAVSFAMQAEDPSRFIDKSPEELAVLPKLAAPLPFDVSVNDGSDGLKIEWGDLSGYPVGTTYVLQRSTNARFSGTVTTLTISGGDFTNGYYNDTDVVTNQTYYYRMKAVCTGYVDSEWAVDSGILSVAEEIINDGLVLLLDSETDVTWTLSGSDKEVESWIDQAQGAQFDNFIDTLLLVDEAALGGKPVITNNGRPTAYMQSTDAPPIGDPAAGMTIFLVGSQRTPNDTDGCFIFNGNNFFLARSGSLTKAAGTIKSANPAVAPAVGSVANNTYYTFRLMNDGMNVSLAINNGDIVNSAIVPQFWVELQTTLFGATESNKSIAFIAIYNRALEAAEITQMENYLKNYYGHY